MRLIATSAGKQHRFILQIYSIAVSIAYLIQLFGTAKYEERSLLI